MPENYELQFESLQNMYPALLQDKELIGAGGTALIVGDPIHKPNPIALKFFYRPLEDAQFFNEDLILNEQLALMLVGGLSIDGVQTPQILTLTEPLDHPRFLSYFSMTRLVGEPVYIDEDRLYEDTKHADVSQIYFESGKLSAAFHRATKNLATPFDGLAIDRNGGKIFGHPSLSAEFNANLAYADLLLQKYKTSGIIHGDFHRENILANPQTMRFTGLIDFGLCSWSGNQYMDCQLIPEDYQNDFERGYAAVAGEDFHPLIPTLTKLSLETQSLRNSSGSDLIVEAAKRNISRHLEKINNFNYS